MRSTSGNASEIEKPSLAATTARGALATVLGQAARFAIQLAGIVILSRILGPSIVGLYATLSIIVGFGEVVRDFGLSSAMIQADRVTQSQRSNLFWINSALGLILAALCVILGPALAAFYNEPQLTNGCIAIGSVLLLGGVGTQFRAQLTRDLKFVTVTAIDVCAAATGLIIGVIFAVAGFGLWSLISQQIAVAAIGTMLNVYLAKWRPSLPSRDKSTWSLVRFGWNVGCTQLVNYISRNVDTVVVGRFFGAEALGLYNRAYQLLTVPLNQLSTPATKVAFPVLSRIRADQQRYNNYLLAGQTALVHVVFAVFVYTMVVAPELITIALGGEWIEVAPIYQILAVAGLIQAGCFPTYWVFLSQGLTGSSLRYTVVNRSILVLAVLVGAFWGVTGVAAGYTLAMVFSWPFGLWWLKRACSGAPVRRMFLNMARIVVIYATAGSSTFFLSEQFISSTWSKLAFSLLVYIALLILLAAIVRPFRADLRQIYSIRRVMARPINA